MTTSSDYQHTICIEGNCTMSDYTPAERFFVERGFTDYDARRPDIPREDRERALIRYRTFRAEIDSGTWKPSYSRWEHGGSYVNNVVYPSGAVGCISSPRHTGSGRYEIAFAPEDHNETDASRGEAARAEAQLAIAEWNALLEVEEDEDDLPDLFGAVAELADVFERTEDAFDLYRAMNWGEASALAHVLHAGNCSAAAAVVVRMWIDSNDEAEMRDLYGDEPARALRRYECASV